MRLRRPSARLSELAFMFVVGWLAAFYLVTLWPQPALDVSPTWCRPSYTPFTPGGHPDPPSYERHAR